jgi:hypothetical protein
MAYHKKETINVSAADGKFIINGKKSPVLKLANGEYQFAFPPSHPIRFSTTPDGVHAGGVAYQKGASYGPQSASLIINQSTPTPLYYYCANHAGMGGKLIR